jgi:flagellar motility protein MotE (MotC chaperone)
MMKFTSGVDGKALLHDLDMKFDSQERMINYLMSQVSSMEQTVQGLNRKAQSLVDQERDARSKLETNFKYTNDQQHYNLTEVLQKINFLEDSIKREEKTKLEMRDRLRVADENNRELMNFIKSIQTQSD